MLSLWHMGKQGGRGDIRVDVYINDTYAGDLQLTQKEWDKLVAIEDAQPSEWVELMSS